MSTGVLLALAAAANSGFALPRNAAVHIDRVYGSQYADVYDHKTCEQDRLTPGNIRKMFATYHELQGTEAHDDYAEFHCGTEGTVVVSGRTFKWNAQPGNTLSTTYPDGKWHSLGGAHSDTLGDDDLQWKRDK